MSRCGVTIAESKGLIFASCRKTKSKVGPKKKFARAGLIKVAVYRRGVAKVASENNSLFSQNTELSAKNQFVVEKIGRLSSSASISNAPRTRSPGKQLVKIDILFTKNLSTGVFAHSTAVITIL